MCHRARDTERCGNYQSLYGISVEEKWFCGTPLTPRNSSVRVFAFPTANCLNLTSATRRLFARGKERVVLYVGYENGALRVYDKVGFVGLFGPERPKGVEDVLELGFVGADRGHW